METLHKPSAVMRMSPTNPPFQQRNGIAGQSVVHKYEGNEVGCHASRTLHALVRIKQHGQTHQRLKAYVSPIELAALYVRADCRALR